MKPSYIYIWPTLCIVEILMVGILIHQIKILWVKKIRDVELSWMRKTVSAKIITSFSEFV